MYRITDGKGFQVTFENGYTLSVQFGPGSHCSHYRSADFAGAAKLAAQGSTTAEVAIITPTGDVEEPRGYVPANELPQIMAECAARA